MLETDHFGNCQVKVTDFGFATFFRTDTKTTSFGVGTPEYSAPEIYDKTNGHNEKVDIWAVGVLTYLLLARLHPFKKDGIVDKVAIREREPDYSPLKSFSDEARAFV